MPVADTEFLFALNPKDRKHQHAIRLLKEVSDLIVGLVFTEDEVKTLIKNAEELLKKAKEFIKKRL